MKRAPKNTPLLFGLADVAAPVAAPTPPPVVTSAAKPIGAGVTDDEAIVTARRHLARAGATNIDDCSATVDGDVVLFSREQACVASLRYTNTGHTAAWATKIDGAIEWTTREVPFESAAKPVATTPQEGPPVASSSEDDRFHIDAARNHLTSVGAVSMHQYAGWIVGDTVWFNRIGEDGGGLNAWLSYDDSGPARGAWLVFAPLAHGGSTAEWSTWARDDLAAPPLDAFKSRKGRVFEVGDGVHQRKNSGDEVGSDTYPIFYGKQPAGSLFRTDSYGRTAAGALRWHASMNPLRWAPFVELPHGEGYDVAAFDSAAECLEAWAVSADQIIDAQEAKAQQDRVDGIVEPVCPRCLGVEPGKPGGAPDDAHPGPFTDELCGACALATKSALIDAKREDPATLAKLIIADLGSAEREMRQMLAELGGDTKATHAISLVLADGGEAFFVADNGTASPVNAVAALSAFRERHPVSYSELYDLTLEMGSPPAEDTDDLGTKIAKEMNKQIGRAEEENARLRKLHAEILGCSVEDLEEKREAEEAEKQAASAQKRAARAVVNANAKTKPAKSAGKGATLVERATAESTRQLTERQRELLGVMVVDGYAAVYPNDAHLPDWKALKVVMEMLGGVYRSKTKTRPAAFVFEDGVDVAEVLFAAKDSGVAYDPKLLPRACGFIPTPDALADRLVEWVDPQPGDVILEPEAGKGRIVKAIVRAYAKESEVKVVCYELLQEHRDELVILAEDADGEIKIIGDDFLKADPEKSTVFDSVAMNPPFENGADIIHVRHAIRFVKPGGKLAAIVSGGAMFRDDKLGKEFRSFVAAHGTIEALPDGSFASEGTGVRTAIVRITACPSCALIPENHSKSTL